MVRGWWGVVLPCYFSFACLIFKFHVKYELRLWPKLALFLLIPVYLGDTLMPQFAEICFQERKTLSTYSKNSGIKVANFPKRDNSKLFNSTREMSCNRRTCSQVTYIHIYFLTHIHMYFVWTMLVKGTYYSFMPVDSNLFKWKL